MADIISFHSENFDFEAMVGEVEILIPKYMDAIDLLKDEENLQGVAGQLHNIKAYWDRLSQLFDIFASHDWDMDIGINFNHVKLNALQTELESLEAVYLKVHRAICLNTSQEIDETLWGLANVILKRMREVLDLLGFDAKHEDHQFVKEMQLKNSQREMRSGIVKRSIREA